MENIRQANRSKHKRILSVAVTQQYKPNILAASISSISVNLIPQAVVLAEDLTKTKSGEGPPNVVLPSSSCFGRQAACELTDTRNFGGHGVLKDNQPLPSQQRVPTLPAGDSSSGSGGAGQDRQDPNGPGQLTSHVAMIISDEDDFTDDPHQIIPTEAKIMHYHLFKWREKMDFFASMSYQHPLKASMEPIIMSLVM